MESHLSKLYMRYISVIGLILITGIVAYYIYLLRIGEAQRLMNSIRDLGYYGIAVGIVVQAVVNVLPVPGEFTTIVLMEIYGPILGGIYSFIGGIIGAVGGLYVSRWTAKPIIGKLVQPYMSRVKEWLDERETMGLLLIRFVPLVPYHFVNYAAGLLNVKLWPYIWTTAVGLVPYTIAVTGLYAGIRNGSLIWGIVGACTFIVLAAWNWYFKRRRQKSLVKI
jgi:uncharacterized membrane protein YdjX (TVP38/TMEM64 family)